MLVKLTQDFLSVPAGTTEVELKIFDLADHGLAADVSPVFMLENEGSDSVTIAFDEATTIDGSYSEAHADVVVVPRGQVTVNLGTALRFIKLSGFSATHAKMNVAIVTF